MEVAGGVECSIKVSCLTELLYIGSKRKLSYGDLGLHHLSGRVCEEFGRVLGRLEVGFRSGLKC